MNWITDDHFIEELHHNAATKDQIKARALLGHLPDVSSDLQRQVLSELDYCEPEFAVPLLGYVLALDLSNIALSREDLQMVLGNALQKQPQCIIDVLIDTSLTDKSAVIELAEMVVTDHILDDVLTRLHELSDPEQIRPLLAILKWITTTQSVSALADYLYVDNRDLILETIQTLSHIGTHDATDALSTRLGTDREFDQLILEAFAAIQTEHAIDKLAETLGASEARTRNLGKTLLTNLGEAALPVLIQTLEKDNTDTLIHTLNVLGAIGSEKAIRPIRNLLHNEPTDPNVRFAAYEALGMLPVQKGAYILASGLTDPDGMVRVAAAKAIEKNLDDTLVAGLRNLTRPDSSDTTDITEALVGAPADNAILRLIEDPNFCTILIDHLKESGHPDSQSHLANLFRRNGQSDLADQISAISQQEQSSDLVVFAVDDSRMILSLYKTALFQIGCDVHLFEFPKRALEEIQNTKPDIVFTDLNMPDMTGVELTAEMRKHYSQEELPIIMVTTQSEGQDASDAQKAGISTIIQKPFTPEMLGQIISEFTRS